MNYWLLQGNPDIFNVDEYLSKTEIIYWSVTVKKFINEMKKGDNVFLWRSKGKKSSPYGVVAFGKITTEPTERNSLPASIKIYDDLWEVNEKERSEIKVGVSIEDYRLSIDNGMITSEDFIRDPVLSQSQIIKARVGSNFKLSSEQFERIYHYWNNLSQTELEYIDEIISSKEGKIKIVKHKVRERDPRLRKKAIKEYIAKHNHLFCELCAFDFEKTYGEIGKDFIECHHYEPLSEKNVSETKVEDLRLLCANCHRMVHRSNPIESYKKIKNLFDDKN